MRTLGYREKRHRVHRLRPCGPHCLPRLHVLEDEPPLHIAADSFPQTRSGRGKIDVPPRPAQRVRDDALDRPHRIGRLVARTRLKGIAVHCGTHFGDIRSLGRSRSFAGFLLLRFRLCHRQQECGSGEDQDQTGESELRTLGERAADNELDAGGQGLLGLDDAEQSQAQRRVGRKPAWRRSAGSSGIPPPPRPWRPGPSHPPPALSPAG